MKIEKFLFNPIGENTYVVYVENGPCAFFDPGCYSPEEKKALVDFVAEKNLTPTRLINTHCHLDHICGNAFVAETWKLKLEASPLDAYNLELSLIAGQNYGMPIEKNPNIEIELTEGETTLFSDIKMNILFTPGHSSGSLSFYFPDYHIVIAGDTLFESSIGRTDLPGGDYDTLIDSIKTKLFTLSDDTLVLSGHGENTTIGHEKKYNPFFNQ